MSGHRRALAEVVAVACVVMGRTVAGMSRSAFTDRRRNAVRFAALNGGPDRRPATRAAARAVGPDVADDVATQDSAAPVGAPDRVPDGAPEGVPDGVPAPPGGWTVSKAVPVGLGVVDPVEVSGRVDVEAPSDVAGAVDAMEVAGLGLDASECRISVSSCGESRQVRLSGGDAFRAAGFSAGARLAVSADVNAARIWLRSKRQLVGDGSAACGCPSCGHHRAAPTRPALPGRLRSLGELTVDGKQRVALTPGMCAVLSVAAGGQLVAVSVPALDAVLVTSAAGVLGAACRDLFGPQADPGSDADGDKDADRPQRPGQAPGLPGSAAAAQQVVSLRPRAVALAGQEAR